MTNMRYSIKREWDGKRVWRCSADTPKKEILCDEYTKGNDEEYCLYCINEKGNPDDICRFKRRKQ